MKRLFTRWLLFTLLIVMSITTAMAQKSVLNESFSSGSLPSDWTMTSGYWNFDAGNAFFLAPFENGADTLFSQLLDISELDNKPSIAFTYSIAANATKVNELKVLYRASEDDDWSVWQTFDAATDGQVYIKDVLPDGLSEVQIAIAGAYKLGGDARVYRIAVENKTEASAAPTGLKTEDLTTTSVTLWWDVCESDMFQQYNVKINTTQMTDMSAIADVVDNVGWFITDEFYELEGLTPNTEYWLYVQYDCGDGDVSPWAELSFRTPCAAITTPFSENFEGELSSCFTIVKEGSAAAVSSEYAYNSNKSFKSVSASGKYNYLILPEAKNNVSAFQVSLWAAAQESGSTYARTVTIGVCTEATAEAFTEIKTLSLPQGRKWEQITVSLASYAGAGKYVALRIGNADKENRLFIDDIRVEAASDCPKPMFVEVSEITPNTAKFKWVETGNASEWNLAISTKPLADPEDLVDIADPTKGEFIDAVSANPYTVTGLLANTTYYAYLQSGCDEAEWTSVVEFKTAREVGYPYEEHFDRMDPDNYTNDKYAVPDGWVMDDRCVNPDKAWDLQYATHLPYVMTTYNHEQTPYVSAALMLQGTHKGTDIAYYSSIAMLPAMPKAVNNMRVTFWANSTASEHKVVIGVAADQSAEKGQGQQLGVNIIAVDTVAISVANTWTKYSVSLKKYAGTGRYITFYLAPGESTPYVYIDDIVIDDIPDCSPVNNLTAAANGANAGNITWADATSATQWNVKISSTEIDPSAANGDIANETVNTKSYAATGLTMGTTYYVYVSPTCGALWESTSFTTQVGLSIPFYTDFTGEPTGANANRGPRNWTVSSTGTALTGAVGTQTWVPYVNNGTSAYSGWVDEAAKGRTQPYLYIYNSTTTTQRYPYAIMPQLLNANVNELKMGFYVNTSNTTALATNVYNVLRIGIVESPSDIGSDITKITNIATVRCKAGRTSEYVYVDFSNCLEAKKGYKYIVFYQDTTKANTSMIDNLTIARLTDPWKVSNVEVSNIEETGAKLTWKENGLATQWNVKVFAGKPDNVDTGTPVFSATVNAKEATITGLTHSTEYYAYVQSDQASGKSDWAEISFWSKTGAWTVPYEENFDSYYATSSYKSIPNYYDLYQADGTALSSFTYFQVYNLNDEQFVKMQATSTTAYKVVTFAFPPFDRPVNTLQVSFQAHADATATSTESAINTAIQNSPTEIGVLESNGTFVSLGSFSVSTNEWEDKYFNFQNYTGAGGRIAIRCDYNKKNATNAIRMDNFYISEIPDCGRLMEVEVNDIDSTTATLSWAKVKSETKWNLKVSSAAMENPDAATADIFDGQLDVQTKALSGLLGNTNYYVYIQTVNEANSCIGDWSSATIFRTLCKQQTLPYTEDFQSYVLYGAGYTPDCSTLSGQDDNHSYISTRGATGNKALQLRQVTLGNNNYFAFPAMNVDSVKRLQLTMFVNPGGTMATNWYYYEVGVMIDPNDPSTYTMVKLDSVAGASNTTFSEKKYTFETYSGNAMGDYGTYIALKPLSYKNKSGTAYAGSVYIDDVTIDYVETCAKPAGLTTSDIGITDVTLTWTTDDAAANHRVRIFANAGADPDNDPFVTESVVADDEATLSGLAGNTTYYAFVRKECGGLDGNSKWSLVNSFHTDCPAVTPMPYVETFESQVSAQVPKCWTNVGAANATVTTTAAQEGTYGLSLPASYSGGQYGSMNIAKLVTPALDVESLKDVLVYFDMKASMTGTSFTIEAVSDNTSTADYIYITTIEDIPTTTWTKAYIKLKDYYTSAQSYKYLRFAPNVPSGSKTSQTIYIDNITFTTNLNEVLPVTALEAMKVTESSLTFSFAEITPGIEEWQTAYVVKDGDIADATIIDTDTNIVTISGLTTKTAYDIYVRSKVEGSAWVGPLTMMTCGPAAAIPYISGFEDNADNALWEVQKLTAANKPYPNYFIIGDADNCDATGNEALYITNNDVDYQYSGKVSYSYAYRTIMFEDAGSYWVSIKVKVPGNARADRDGDCIYAHLVPAGTTFLASNINLMDGTSRNYASTSDSKNCYSLVGKTTHQSDWTTFSRQLDITEAGAYMVVIVWTNNTTDSPGQPVAVDSVSVTEYLCTVPSGFEYTGLSTNTAAFQWFAGKCKKFEYVVSRYAKLGNPAVIDDEDKAASGIIASGPQASFNGLQPGTDYSLYVRTICEDGYTEWVEKRFTTPCAAEDLPYTESFAETPECWVFSNASVVNRTQHGDEEEIWPCLQLNAGGMAILPELSVPLNKVRVEIGAFNSTSYASVSLGIVDNTWDASTFSEQYYFAPVNKQVSSSDPFVLETSTKMLNLYQGSGKYLALRNTSGNTIYVKYISLTELPNCIQPSQVELTNITETTATVNWIAGLETAWEIKLNDSIIKNVTTQPYQITGLEQGTEYTVAVRAICDSENTSEWSVSADFQTLCGVFTLPMFEDFTDLPKATSSTNYKRAQLRCWDNMVTDQAIEQVFNGNISPYTPLPTVSNTYLWVCNYLPKLGDNNQLFFFGYSLSHSGPKYRWMITPQYAIEGAATLSFDVCHKDNQGLAAHPNGRFFVAISTDNGDTWKKADATEIKDIDSVMTTKSVSLNKYAGQNIRVAFYMEDLNGTSTTSGSGIFTLVDNVRMNCTDTYPYADNACQGFDYEGYGFSIAKEDLPIADKDSTYYRFAANAGAGCDSTIALTITTRKAAEVAPVYAEICRGESYDFGPLKLTEPNPVGVPYYISGETQYGCDSTIYLYLTVNESDTTDMTPVEVKANQLPYVVDEYYTIPMDASVGSFTAVAKRDGCSFNRYFITVLDNPTGVINITDEIDYIEVYDALGRKVQTLRQGDLQNNLPRGVYMIRTIMKNGDAINRKVTF
ncbi:MAG: fibronectin type III domain-containing protein [Paludibacteraceae bacterium]|nr:fibronectin type III domain-containing protein [Paludibacteraceae bacterium]